jgi:CheY-like chemotaxis protein
MTQYIPSKYVLYAEDDHDDQELLQSLIPMVDPDLHVVTVNNGLELIQFLDQLGPDSPAPCLIILDVNMPLWDGIQTLRALKSLDRFMNLPVVMFSTSNDRKDVELALRLGAHDFITKPVRHAEIENIVKRFTEVCHDFTLQRK